MTKISLKNLRKEIPQEMIPGNFVRGKEIVFTYLIVSEVEGEYYVNRLHLIGQLPWGDVLLN